MPFLFLLFWACKPTINNQPLTAARELQGHRGARGLAPENTLPGFALALEHGMTTLELDTVLTKDNQLIIHHDTATNPSLCQQQSGHPIQSQPIRSLHSEELKKLDCGSLTNPDFRFGQSQMTNVDFEAPWWRVRRRWVRRRRAWRAWRRVGGWRRSGGPQ